MKTIEYEVSDMNQADLDIFTDMLSYISEYLIGVEKKGNKLLIDIVETKEDEVQEKIKQLRQYLNLDEVKSGREVTTKILQDFRYHVPINHKNIFEELLESGSVVRMAEGAYAYTGIFLKVFHYFSRKIEEFGMHNFNGIQEYEESVTYPVEEYERGHYFESFPHHIMFQTAMRNDMKLLDEFSKEGASNPEIFSNKNMKKPVNVLRHAACVPIYPMLRDKLIPQASPRYFLISGKCFRNEGGNVFELSRLNEFYMKEFVCVGTLEQVEDMILRGKALWQEWIDIFGLCATIETANDSFFANNYKKLKIFQIMGNSKQEFKIQIPHNDSFCAVSSANVHRTHFTKTYHIHNENALCQSGCFAFGIERLTYALLSQKGCDISKWDEATKKEIFGGGA